MKKYFLMGVAVALLLVTSSCNKPRFGQLTGVNPPGKWTEPTPIGMNFIHQGAFQLGVSDQDPAVSGTPVKTVTVDAFWMDDTEITNNEYRQFVYWVRDSIARKKLGEQYPEFLTSEDREGNPIDLPTINWREKIDWKNPEYQQAMSDLYMPEHERFYGKNEVDPRKLVYEYWWIDLQQAARRINSYNYDAKQYTGNVYNAEGELIPVVDRSSFILHEQVHVYPDTLVWIRDFTYAYNDPRTRRYFYHPAFDDYPVVGVTWKQAEAFCNWRSNYRNDFLSKHRMPEEEYYRLPTEVEWEYAARGDQQAAMFPWGAYYSRKENGEFMANFKPLRGNYVEDGGVATLNVRSFEPNNFGLYDMAGNVAEWTSNAYDESAYFIINDFNPNFEYHAKKDDPPVMKRKVIRGGSWKDIIAFQQVGTRSYEYQDSTKSHLGFRCVRSSLCDVTRGNFAPKK